MFNLTGGTAVCSENEGLPLVSFSPVDEQTVALLYSNAQGLGRFVENNWIPHPAPQGRARIVLLDARGEKKDLPYFELPNAWARFSMLPSGGWVVAHQTVTSGKKSPDARIFSAGGALRKHFETGGAVEFMQLSSEGDIWIGHGDEGSISEKLGGLSRFSQEGRAGQYIEFDGSKTSYQSEMSYWCCYALNVVGEQAWTQFYSDMLVSCHETGGSSKQWQCWNKGASAIIAKGNMIALAGRYGETRFEIRLYQLKESPTSQFKGSTRFVIDDRKPEYFSIEGKCDVFHILCENRWYRARMDELFRL